MSELVVYENVIKSHWIKFPLHQFVVGVRWLKNIDKMVVHECDI